MRVDRHVAVLLLATPALLISLSMLARTEVFLGSEIRKAVERRAAPLGADVEITTVVPSGLFGVELQGVNARVPRGDFAVEAALDRVVLTVDLGSVLSGPIEVEHVELGDGVVAIVPWSSEPATPLKPQPKQEKAGAGKPKPAAEAEPIEVELDNVQVVAFSDRYATLPLELKRVEFSWTRGAPIADLAGYGSLPDGVEFSIVAEEGAYWLRPQRSTRVDRWVAPRRGGVAWPIALSSRDVRICVDCEDVLSLEDIVLSVPRWRDDIQLTAPSAAVWRKGNQVGLRAPEMAIVDRRTRDFAARLTETDFQYALDTGRLAGRVELADPSGGLLDLEWTWNAEDFDVRFEAERFALSSVWYLVGLGDFVRPHSIDGTSSLRWDLRHQTVGIESMLRVDRVAVNLPWTQENFDLRDATFELDAFFDVRGRALSLRRAAMTVGQTRPIVASATLVQAGQGVSYDLAFEVEKQAVSPLVTALPEHWTSVVSDAEFEGDVALHIGAVGHTA